MLRTKVYESYYPYIDGHNGVGKEYCFDETEEEVIDYNNYYHSSFDLFWEGLKSRYFELEPNYTSFPFDKDDMKSKLVELYRVQLNEKAQNPYYFYINLNSDKFYNKFDEGLKNKLKFLIDQNEYIKETWTVNEDSSFDEDKMYYLQKKVGEEGKEQKNLYEYQPFDSLDPDETYYVRSTSIKSINENDPQYKAVGFYMGVDEFADISSTGNGEIIQKFHYYEFKMIKKKIQHKIISLRIDAPIGTSFYLNRSLHPLTIYKYANPFILDNLKGYYEIQPEDYVTLKYLTFPKDAIPKYKKVLDGSHGTRNSNDNDFYLTVSYLYDDDYDVEYKEE